MRPLYHAVQLPLFVFSKICPTCQPPTEKPIDDFPRSSSKYSKDGHGLYCKVCCRTLCKAYYAAHREEYSKKNLANYYANVEFYRARNREYRETHKEQAKSCPTWRENDPLGYAEYMRRRYALKKALTVGEVNYERVLERDGFWCYICMQDILPHHKIDFDHVIPLSRNGAHCEDNIKPTHRVCNRRKNKKLLEEMTPHQRRGPS